MNLEDVTRAIMDATLESEAFVTCSCSPKKAWVSVLTKDGDRYRLQIKPEQDSVEDTNAQSQ